MSIVQQHQDKLHEASQTFQNFRSRLVRCREAGTGDWCLIASVVRRAGWHHLYRQPGDDKLNHSTGLGSGVTWSVDGSHSTFKLWNNPGAGSFFLNIASKGTLLGRGLVRQDTQSVKDKFVNLGLGFGVGPSLAAGYKFGGRTNYRSVLTRTTKNNNFRMGNYAVNFTSGVNGFFGFRFTDTGLTNTFYGWAELNLDTTSPGTMTINRWAYNNVAGGSIKVGQTTADTSVPEPGTLSLTLLGLGAGGVRAWRKRKQALAA